MNEHHVNVRDLKLSDRLLQLGHGAGVVETARDLGGDEVRAARPLFAQHNLIEMSLEITVWREWRLWTYRTCFECFRDASL